MDENTKILMDIVAGQGRIEQKVDNLKDDVCANAAEIKSLKEKPARKWDTATNGIIAAVIAAVVSFFTKYIK